MDNPSRILMIRPAHFGANPETAADNPFQSTQETPSDLSQQALREFDALVDELQLSGVEVLVIEDREKTVLPDAVFPNNWLSFHSNGAVFIYPMHPPSRRAERRDDIVPLIQQQGLHPVEEVMDWSHYEQLDQALEGTGSLVVDEDNRRVYAALSTRTRVELVSLWARKMEFEYTAFHTSHRGMPIYHTNVMMSVGPTEIVACPAVIHNKSERLQFERALATSGKTIVEITPEQVDAFCGNIIALRGLHGTPTWWMSETAHRHFRLNQLEQLEQHSRIKFHPIPTIEKFGGGSLRCTICIIA